MENEGPVCNLQQGLLQEVRHLEAAKKTAPRFSFRHPVQQTLFSAISISISTVHLVDPPALHSRDPIALGRGRAAAADAAAALDTSQKQTKMRAAALLCALCAVLAACSLPAAQATAAPEALSLTAENINKGNSHAAVGTNSSFHLS
jgi:hypothetical protein